MAVPRQRITETMNVSESRKQYSELLNRVYKDEDQVIIEKNGIPMAAIVPISVVRDAEARQRQRERALSSLREVRAAFADAPEDELERELEKALEEAKNVQLSKRLAAEDIDAG
jgi:prevent-host-death family protein